MLFTGSKNIFHEDMSLRSWYFIRVNRVFQGVFLGILIFKFQNLSPRVFKIITRGFRRYKGADIAKKCSLPIFYFLVLWFFFINKKPKKIEKNFLKAPFQKQNWAAYITKFALSPITQVKYVKITEFGQEDVWER